MWLVIGGPGDTGTCFRKRMSREGGMKEIDRGELNRKQESDRRRIRECQGKEEPVYFLSGMRRDGTGIC